MNEVKVIKECDKCTYWSRHVCEDFDGNPIKRESKLAEPFWYYEVCKKNWGLPQQAVTNANTCKHYKENK